MLGIKPSTDEIVLLVLGMGFFKSFFKNFWEEVKLLYRTNKNFKRKVNLRLIGYLLCFGGFVVLFEVENREISLTGGGVCCIGLILIMISMYIKVKIEE